MSPDVAAAVEDLHGRGILTGDQTRLFSRVARDELVSVHGELHALLYAGVLVTMAGVGLLVKDQLARLGPLTIALALALAAAGCFAWVARHAAPFSWSETVERHIGVEYILLLGVLLVAADLAYVETQFEPLGPNWPWHLLLVSLFSAALAVRYDSRIVFSLALSSFAAWRGASVQTLERSLWIGAGGVTSLRANAIGCGVLFLMLGLAAVRAGRKPHFEPVLTHLGWLLVLGALVSGLGASGPPLFELALLAVGAGLAAASYFRARFSLFAFGVIAAYIALSSLFLRARPPGEAVALWFLVSSLAVLAGLIAVHRRLGAPE